MAETFTLMRLSPAQRLAAVWGPTVVVLSFGALAYWGNLREMESREAVAASHRVIETLQQTLIRLVDAETGQRGYLLTGRREYLGPYLLAKADVQRSLAEVKRLTSDSPAQRAMLDSLSSAASAKFDELEETIRVRRAGRLDAVQTLLGTDRGLRTMTRARALAAAVRRAEIAELAERSRHEELTTRIVTLLLIVGALLAAGVSRLLGRVMHRYAAAQERIARELEAANHRLRAQQAELGVQNEQLQEQQAELEVQNEHLQDQQAELEVQNEHLQDQQAELGAQNEQLVNLASELEIRTEAAEGANRAKARFLAAVSHDLRTPLNAISGYTDLIEMGVRGPVTQAQVQDLRRIRVSSQRLLTLISDILSFARLEAGKVEISARPVPLDATLRGLESSFLPQLAARQLRYRYLGCDRRAAVQADPDRMEQVLLNLIGNAIKFTEPGGGITLEVELSDVAEIHVRDTGVGIPSARLSEIFEPFVQLDGERTANHSGGVGLGLAISRELALGMNGDLRAESQEGVGSRFTLRLPLAGAEPAETIPMVSAGACGVVGGTPLE